MTSAFLHGICLFLNEHTAACSAQTRWDIYKSSGDNSVIGLGTSRICPSYVMNIRLKLL